MTHSAGPVLKKLHEEFGDQVAFVRVYVREAHPSERFPQADSLEQKMQYARIYKERDEIPWPVAVDDINGSFHRMLDPKPNATYVVDIDGDVAFRSTWSNDTMVLREALQSIVSQPRQVVGEREPKVIPMLAGVGDMYEILDFAGEQAKRDVLFQAPPIYGMARLANLFKPLPPLGRGIAAAATSMLVAGLIVGGLRSFSKKRRAPDA